MLDIKVLPSVEKEPGNQSGGQKCQKSWRIVLRVLQSTESTSSDNDSSPLPQLPLQKVATDLFEWKQMYLLIVDCYSWYIEIVCLKGATAEEVIIHTKITFARHGIPKVVISDNGPQFSLGAYHQFAQRSGKGSRDNQMSSKQER